MVHNRGTIGGSLCQADPAEDLSAVCTALGATCVVRGWDGERELTMEQFHLGPYETACGPAEMLTSVQRFVERFVDQLALPIHPVDARAPGTARPLQVHKLVLRQRHHTYALLRIDAGVSSSSVKRRQTSS